MTAMITRSRGCTRGWRAGDCVRRQSMLRPHRGRDQVDPRRLRWQSCETSGTAVPDRPNLLTRRPSDIRCPAGRSTARTGNGPALWATSGDEPLGVKVDSDWEQLGTHDLHNSAVQAQADLPQAFLGIVVGKSMCRAGAPLAPELHANARVGFDVAHVVRAATVLGDQPEVLPSSQVPTGVRRG